MPDLHLVSTAPAKPPAQPWPVQSWSFTPVPEQIYLLEVSTDLTNWTLDPTNLLNGTISFELNGARKFFRLAELSAPAKLHYFALSPEF